MLNPGKVSITLWRQSILPAWISLQMFLTPVTNIKRRIGQDIISFQVGKLVIHQGVAAFDIRINSPNCHVHFSESPSGFVELLAIHRDITDTPSMLLDKLLTPDEHTAATATRVIHAPTVRLKHFYQQLHDGARRVEFATMLTLTVSKHTHKIFVDLTKQIFGTGSIKFNICK